jgi:hypothetical protein
VVLEAPTAMCNAAAMCLGASHNGSTADEQVSFTANPTSNYWIIVDGKSGVSSPYTVTVGGCP